MKSFRPSFSRRFVGNGDVTVLEIGANDGEDSEEFLRTFTNRNFHLYCFECDPRAIARWKARVHHPRSTLVESAVADRSGVVPFYQSTGRAAGARWRTYGDWDKSGSILPPVVPIEHSPWLSFKEPVFVSATTLDAWADMFIPGKIIDFCWLSVQGAEHLVLLNGLNAIRRIRYLYCKCDPFPAYQGQASLEAIKTILESNGFVQAEQYGDHGYLWKNLSPDSHGRPITTFSADEVSSLLNSPPQATSEPIIQLEHEDSLIHPEYDGFIDGDLVTSIVTPLTGQFGDQLFQYVAGKIMAEVTGLSYVPPFSFLTQHGHPVTWSSSPVFIMTPTLAKVIRKGGFAKQFIGEHWIDWNEFKGSSQVFMQGFFQRYECIKPWKEQIKSQWLVPQVSVPTSNASTLYIHHQQSDHPITAKEYDACISQFSGIKRLAICTSDPNNDSLKVFDQFGIPWTITNGSWDSDFLALLSAKSLIISQTTYAWWAAILGQAEKVVCPIPKGTPWSQSKSVTGRPKAKQDQPNLIVDDEAERWVWMDDSAIKAHQGWTAFE